MPAALLPNNEKERLNALHSLNLLDSPPDPAFDRITRLAARTLGVPMAMISFMDKDRQWFKSSVGIGAKEIPRDSTFCTHTILQSELTLVPDAKLDLRFADNSSVEGDPCVRFYAGVPICNSTGLALGTFCVVDTKPRELTPEELEVFADLAAMVNKEIHQHEAFVLHLHNMADAIEESDARFRTMFERAAVGIALVAPNGRWLRVNDALCKIVGYSSDELTKLTFQNITFPEDLSKSLYLDQELIEGRIDHYYLDKRYVRKDGEIIWISIGVTKQVTMDGSLDCFIAIVENIQARKVAEASLAALHRDLEKRVDERTNELRTSNEMLSHSMAQKILFQKSLLRRESELRTVLENANDAYVCIDSSGVVSAWNRLAFETFGWTAEEAIGTTIEDLIIPEKMREAHRIGMQHYLNTGEAKVLDQRLELPAIRKDGSSLDVEIRIRAIDIEGQKIFSAFLHDITERKRAEAIREREALLDPLTGLPNRRALFEILPKAIARSNRNQKSMAVLFLDLDNFKIVNDTLGHEAGDILLVEIAQRILACIRQSDTALRLSGDEFTVLLENLVSGVDDAQKVAEKLLASISAPVQIGKELAQVGVSIGIVVHSGDQNISADDLLKTADKAMYEAKHKGKSAICIA